MDPLLEVTFTRGNIYICVQINGLNNKKSTEFIVHDNLKTNNTIYMLAKKKRKTSLMGTPTS